MKQQRNSQEALASAPLWPLMLRLALPAVVAQVVNLLYNIVDRIFIGHMPGDGDLALTGVGVCMPLIMIVSAFAALAGGGGAPRASIFMGKGQNEDAEKTMAGCFSLLAVIAVVLTAVLLVLNLMSPLWNEQIGIALNAALVIVSAPMVCSNFYVLPLFLWGTLLAAAFRKK